MQLRWRAFARFQWAWRGYERLSLWLHPVTPVRPGSLFGYRVRGAVVELHLDGAGLARLRQTPGYSTFKAVHILRDDLAALATRIKSGDLGEVTTIRGTSLIGRAGAVLGFETRPLRRSLSGVLGQYFLVGLDAIYHPRGLRPRAARRWPYETWMTVDDLLRLYPEKSRRSTRAR